MARDEVESGARRIPSTVENAVRGPKAKSGQVTASPASLARRARDARSVRSKKAVLEAATALFVDVGHAGFSINAIVRVTGIAKTTIYRHWPTQGHLLTAVIARLSEQFEIPDSGTLRNDLIEYYLARAHTIFNDPKHRTLQSLPGLLQVAQHEAGLSNVVDYAVGKLLEALRLMISRAKARGELREGRNVELMVRMMFGAMSARAILNEDYSDDQIIEMIDLVLHGMLSV
jgi:AcrR family transcriptional regulator